MCVKKRAGRLHGTGDKAVATRVPALSLINLQAATRQAAHTAAAEVAEGLRWPVGAFSVVSYTVFCSSVVQWIRPIRSKAGSFDSDASSYPLPVSPGQVT